MSAETFYAQYVWFPCRASLVRAGDIYANHATVTASRKATSDDGWGPSMDWTIECGPDFTCGSPTDSLVVIGRKTDQ